MHKEQIERDILKILGEKNQELKVSGRVFFTEGIINLKFARGWLIIQRFWDIRKSCDKTNLEIMKGLSIEYDVSVRHIKYLLKIK